MPENWKTFKLGSLITLITDYHANGAYKKLKENVKLLDRKDYAAMIRSTNFEKNDFEDLIYIDQNAYEFLNKSKVFTGDVLMNKIANPGTVYYMPELEIKVSLGMNLFLIRFDEKLTDPYFIYKYLRANERYVKSFSAGSVTRTITKDAVRNLDITLPPLQEQKAIAAILSALDDKIELNLQMNKTLEDMAMALYKHWFVDFGPFQNGNFVESELGMIPEGWEVKKLGDLITVLSKGTTPRMKDVGGLEATIPFLKVKDIKNDGEINNENIDLIPEAIHLKELKRSILEKGDILFSIAGTIGRISSVTEYLDNSNCNQALAFIRLKDKQKFKSLIYYWLKSEGVQNKISNSVVQGVQANISLTVLKDLMISIPNESYLDEFSTIINPLFQQILHNQEENGQLSKTRDTLLPKLISGEVRVKDVEQMLAATL